MPYQRTRPSSAPPRDDDDFLAEASPPDDLERTEEPAHLHELLLKTTLFEARYVGAGANRSRGSTAFQTILKHRDAAGCFQDLVERGHLAGQLCGLCGLYLADRDAYEAAVKPYRDSRALVPKLFGCLGGYIKVSTGVREIDNGSWPLGLRRL